VHRTAGCPLLLCHAPLALVVGRSRGGRRALTLVPVGVVLSSAQGMNCFTTTSLSSVLKSKLHPILVVAASKAAWVGEKMVTRPFLSAALRSFATPVGAHQGGQRKAGSGQLRGGDRAPLRVAKTGQSLYSVPRTK